MANGCALSSIVLLRGLIRSRFHWEDFPQRLQEHFPGHSVITPELAGNGERYQEHTPFSIAAMMENIRQQVIQNGDHTQPIIMIAVSMGAMIATEWARQYPHEIAQLHLINTSFSNLSLPWQRMQAAAFFSLISRLGNRQALERAIIRWTINQNKTPQLEKRWLAFAAEHPLSYRNALAQLLSASQYRGPLMAPIEDVYCYRSQQDHLVNSRCTERIAQRWQKKLVTHPCAGHDLSLDDPDWLIQQLAVNAALTNTKPN